MCLCYFFVISEHIEQSVLPVLLKLSDKFAFPDDIRIEAVGVSVTRVRVGAREAEGDGETQPALPRAYAYTFTSGPVWNSAAGRSVVVVSGRRGSVVLVVVAYVTLAFARCVGRFLVPSAPRFFSLAHSSSKCVRFITRVPRGIRTAIVAAKRFSSRARSSDFKATFTRPTVEKDVQLRSHLSSSAYIVLLCRTVFVPDDSILHSVRFLPRVVSLPPGSIHLRVFSSDTTSQEHALDSDTATKLRSRGRSVIRRRDLPLPPLLVPHVVVVVSCLSWRESCHRRSPITALLTQLYGFSEVACKKFRNFPMLSGDHPPVDQPNRTPSVIFESFDKRRRSGRFPTVLFLTSTDSTHKPFLNDLYILWLCAVVGEVLSGRGVVATGCRVKLCSFDRSGPPIAHSHRCLTTLFFDATMTPCSYSGGVVVAGACFCPHLRVDACLPPSFDLPCPDESKLFFPVRRQLYMTLRMPWFSPSCVCSEKQARAAKSRWVELCFAVFHRATRFSLPYNAQCERANEAYRPSLDLVFFSSSTLPVISLLRLSQPALMNEASTVLLLHSCRFPHHHRHRLRMLLLLTRIGVVAVVVSFGRPVDCSSASEACVMAMPLDWQARRFTRVVGLVVRHIQTGQYISITRLVNDRDRSEGSRLKLK
ncbi:unnamed protein product [Soboliphyme baturini]|uniref:Transmembrane protein n=1 Tax=Soboliphyme baturini TaxID=241478 RepID=A0A183IH77_9BILA|nr:unnamed protein product [Soboliphyme baturini]